jgi:hypothetical protein
MKGLEVISEAITPIANLIDKMNTSGDERGQLRLKFAEMQGKLVGTVLDYEKSFLNAQQSIITAEIAGKSWLQRNWRPGLMTLFGVIVGWNFLIVPVIGAFIELNPAVLPDHLWQLLKIGVGGYIVGRSGEKIALTLTDKELSCSKDKKNRKNDQ